MKRILVLLFLLFSVSLAEAQSPVKLCIPTSAANTNCIVIWSGNPLPVSATLTFPTIGAAVPATGVYNALNVAGTLRGWSGLSTGAIFPGAVAIVDGSGNQITSFGASNTYGSAFPSTGTPVGFSDGTNMRAALVTSVAITGSITMPATSALWGLSVPCLSNGDGTCSAATGLTAGTAGSASTQVLSIQGIANMTPVQATLSAIATGGASYARIAAGQATTVVKASAGTLYSVCLNSAATATNTTNIYDNASGAGTVIGTPAVTTATVPTCLTYGPVGVAFANGLTIITATANGGDMTVSYK